MTRFGSKHVGAAALGMSLLLPATGMASGFNATGGFEYGNSKQDDYWFSLGGVLKFDQRFYTGEVRKTTASSAGIYHSGASIRDAGLTFKGGLGKNFSYTLVVSSGSDSKIALESAFLTYKGLNNIASNLAISVGQVDPGFCLESSTSSKWTAFMERSLATTAFRPCSGLGASVNSWNNNYSFTAAVYQPKQGASVKNSSNGNVTRSDRWQGSLRATYAPIAEAGRVFQIGASLHGQRDDGEGISFSGTETKSRNTTTLLNTTSSTGTLIASRRHQTVDLEAMGIHGPWSGQVEYQKVYVKRGKDSVTGNVQGSNLSFNGYHVQVSYVLTGESRTHVKSNGTLGQIKPKCATGAWELSGRYSYLNLNDNDIRGGAAHNTSASLSWYANNNIRVIGEYVHSKQNRDFTAGSYLDKRIVQSAGMRLQLVF